MNKRHLFPTISLLIQIIITVLYLTMVTHVLVTLSIDKSSFLLTASFVYMPQLVILISSMVPQIALRISRKLHSEDGEILPLLFTIIALQSSIIIPIFAVQSGYFILPPSTILIIERFSILASASIFLLSSLEYYGFQNAKVNLYTIYILLACLIIALIAPTNNNRDYIDIHSAYSDSYIFFACFLIYIATCITFILYAIKEKTALNIRRCISFIFLIIGIVLSLVNGFISAILSCVLYIIGIIILVFNTRESF